MTKHDARLEAEFAKLIEWQLPAEWVPIAKAALQAALTNIQATEPKNVNDICQCADTRIVVCGKCWKPLPDDDGSYLWQRCYGCGHRLAYASDSCPQCGIHFIDGDDPPNWPETCACDRCVEARLAEAADDPL